LAGGHAFGLIVPLLTVPYLARVLRPEGWAPVLVAQALAAWMLLLLDYGFDLSATRAIAEARGKDQEINGIAWSVQSAKLLLVPIAMILMLGAYIGIPALRESPQLMFWTCMFGIARGLNPLWFFQGLEQMRGAVLADTIGKISGALGVFLFVQNEKDGWKVLALQAIFAAMSCGWLTIRLLRVAPGTAWSLTTAITALRTAWPLFVFRASSTLYMQANTIILSVFSSPAAVAAYGGAERVVRASINLLEPVTRLFLPRISFLSASNPVAAAQLIQRCLIMLGIGSALAGAVMSLSAPLLVKLLLGDGYELAIPVLRWLALLLPIITIATVLGTFWALPYKRDRIVLGATVAAGAVNLGVAALLVPGMAALGMTAAVVSAELIVGITLGVMYSRWRGAASQAAVAS
jgi:PST family polysaccharide transporter